jgi:metallo-beta-lactamase family protein
MNSFSAHADYHEMQEYLECLDAKKVRKVFLVHGEYDVQVDWREKLVAQGFKSVEIPDMKSTFELI